MAKPKVKERDLGYSAAMKRIREIGGHYVTVGVHASEGARQGAEADNVLIASVHEFGTADGRVPQRSFIRSTIDSRAKDIEEVRKKLHAQVVDGKLTPKQASDILGQWVEAAMRKTISSNIPPPLQPETIAAKGSSVSLIDTGQLRASIRAITHEGKPPKGSG